MTVSDIVYYVSQWVQATSAAHPWLAPVLVFAGGVVTALNPCSIAALPLMMGYIAAQAEKSWKKSLLLSAAFVIGLALIFTLIGILGAVFKTMAGAKAAKWGVLAVGTILLLAGAWFMDLLKVPMPMPNLADFRHRGIVGAFLLGMIFSISAGPCAGPMAGVIIALMGGNISYGALLFFLFSMGTGVIVVIAALSTGVLHRLAALSLIHISEPTRPY